MTGNAARVALLQDHMPRVTLALSAAEGVRVVVMVLDCADPRALSVALLLGAEKPSGVVVMPVERKVLKNSPAFSVLPPETSREIAATPYAIAVVVAAGGATVVGITTWQKSRPKAMAS